MSVSSLELIFKDGSRAEVDFNETDPGDGLAPYIHIWPAFGVDEVDVRERVQALLDKYFCREEVE